MSRATDTAAAESWTGCDDYPAPNEWSTPIQVNIKYNKSSFGIDGRMEPEWTRQPEITATNYIEPDAHPSNPDVSFKFRLSVNDTAIHLIANVTDDHLSPGDHASPGDHLDLFLNPNNNHLPIGVYDDHAVHLRMQYGSQGIPQIIRGDWKSGDYEGFRYATTDTAGGYILEARIPWKGILPMEIDEAMSRYMGLEVQVNDWDQDSVVENKLAWANNTGNDYSGYDTRKFGTLAITRDDDPVYVTGVEIDMDTLILESGKILKMTATVFPEDADNKTVTWKTLDATVINLDPSTGTCQGFYPGTTLLIVTTQDGGFTDTCTVIVPDPNSSTSLEDREWTDPAVRDISLVPNPASESFWIKGIDHWNELEIYSMTGELVKKAGIKTQGEYIEVSDLGTGLYIVRVHTDRKIYLKKLVIK
jgi:hypothetical protein